MSLYHVALFGLLVVAGIANLYHLRALILVFLSSIFLLFLQKLLPQPDTLQSEWFILLIGCESLFAVISLLSSTRAGLWIAGFCLWNILGHLLGRATYLNGSDLYDLYSPIIRAGEICQALALILFSDRVIRLAVLCQAKRQGADDEWYRVEHDIS